MPRARRTRQIPPWANQAARTALQAVLRLVDGLLPRLEPIYGVIDLDVMPDQTELAVESTRRERGTGRLTGRLRVTTERQYLAAGLFEENVRVRINRRDRQPGRADGRVLWCLDVDNDTVMAALMFHVHGPGTPLLVTAIATRHDGDDQRRRASLMCATYLKAFAHAIGELGEFGEVLGYDVRTRDEANASALLGFRPATPPTGLAGNLRGFAYLQQPAFTRAGLRAAIVRRLRAVERALR